MTTVPVLRHAIVIMYVSLLTHATRTRALWAFFFLLSSFFFFVLLFCVQCSVLCCVIIYVLLFGYIWGLCIIKAAQLSGS
jgi:hypothetical protein